MPGDNENVVVSILWIGGTSTEHAPRRPISRYERLSDFPRMRRLVEDAVAAGQSAVQIAECLDREGFRPPSGRADRFTPGRARDLVYRLGLSPRQRPAESLAVDEWWIRDLADELGVGYNRFKEWAKKGYVHARQVGRRRHLVIWADAEERDRLRRLKDAFRPGRTNGYPVELTRPKARPEQKRGRRAQPYCDEIDAGLAREEPTVPGHGTTEGTAVTSVKRGGLPGGPPLFWGVATARAGSRVVRPSVRRGIFRGWRSPES
jgi:hypothetical protein